MPHTEMRMDLRQWREMTLKSSSMPITKRNRARATLPNSASRGSDAGGKMVAAKPGMRDSALGPSRMPAMISDTTGGCRSGDSRSVSARPTPRMTAICTTHCANGSAMAGRPAKTPPSEEAMPTPRSGDGDEERG